MTPSRIDVAQALKSYDNEDFLQSKKCHVKTRASVCPSVISYERIQHRLLDVHVSPSG
jgi:hypothetical protein